MKYVTIQQVKEEVLTKCLLIDTFVKYKKFDYPAGKAVFDVNRGMVIRQVSDDYKLITNEDLVKWLKSRFKVKFLNIYKTKSMDTMYIEGFMPEFNFEDAHNRQFFISFEIANSYSSRFLPVINIGIFYPYLALNIKTDVKVTPKVRNGLLDQPFNPDIINGLIEFTQDDGLMPDLIPSLIQKLPDKLPAKLKEKASIIVASQNYRTFPISYLETVAKVASIWKYTAYELSRTFQMEQYKYLIKRMINI